MTEPDSTPREKGAIPDGAIMREDGSYVLPDETADIESGTHDEAGNLIVSEQADVLPARETGTDVQGQREQAATATKAAKTTKDQA